MKWISICIILDVNHVLPGKSILSQSEIDEDEDKFEDIEQGETNLNVDIPEETDSLISSSDINNAPTLWVVYLCILTAKKTLDQFEGSWILDKASSSQWARKPFFLKKIVWMVFFCPVKRVFFKNLMRNFNSSWCFWKLLKATFQFPSLGILIQWHDSYQLVPNILDFTVQSFIMPFLACLESKPSQHENWKHFNVYWTKYFSISSLLLIVQFEWHSCK